MVQAKEFRQPLEAGIGKKQTPIEPPEGTRPANTLILASQDLFQNFDLWNCKLISLGYLKSLSFVTAVITKSKILF